MTRATPRISYQRVMLAVSPLEDESMDTLSRRNFVAQSAALAGMSLVADARSPQHGRLVSRGGGDVPLEAGAAVADLTPPTGLPMWGYSNPEQISSGTLDPLYGKAVVLRVGELTLGLISMDFGRMPTPSVCEAIRSRVRPKGIEEVIFCATHTHSGPMMELPGLPHTAGMESALVDLLLEAMNKLQPVRLGVGKATLDIAHNRRVVVEGQCWMRWRNLERLPSSPLDQELTALQLETPSGTAVATLVHYACHPVILGPDNTRYSADWCGAMCRDVQEETGAPCLFLQGAAGDINPYYDKMSLDEGAVAAVAAEGKKAASAVFDAIRKLTWQTPEKNTLAFERTTVNVGTRYDLSDPGQLDILRQASGRLVDVYMAGVDPALPLPLDSLVIQDGVALSFQPGEPFVQFQLDLKARGTVAHSLLCGYANEFHIYFPTVPAAIIGGYGATSATYVGIGAGEKLLAASFAQIGRLTGKLGPLKGPEDLQSQDWVPGVTG